MSGEQMYITFLVLFFFFGIGASIVENLPKRKKTRPMATKNGRKL